MATALSSWRAWWHHLVLGCHGRAWTVAGRFVHL